MAELINLDDYKEYKGQKSTETDPRRQHIIDMVCELVENYCNRKFFDYAVSPGTIEYFDAKQCEVTLKHFPVLSVDSVRVSDNGGKTFTDLSEAAADNSGYYVNLTDGIVSTQRGGVPFLTYMEHPYHSLEITYKAGYTEVPEDLKIAMYDMVDYYEDEKGVISKSLGSAVLENPFPIAGVRFPANIQRTLNLYRVTYV